MVGRRPSVYTSTDDRRSLRSYLYHRATSHTVDVIVHTSLKCTTTAATAAPVGFTTSSTPPSPSRALTLALPFAPPLRARWCSASLLPSTSPPPSHSYLRSHSPSPPPSRPPPPGGDGDDVDTGAIDVGDSDDGGDTQDGDNDRGRGGDEGEHLFCRCRPLAVVENESLPLVYNGEAQPSLHTRSVVAPHI